MKTLWKLQPLVCLLLLYNILQMLDSMERGENLALPQYLVGRDDVIELIRINKITDAENLNTINTL